MKKQILIFIMATATAFLLISCQKKEVPEAPPIVEEPKPVEKKPEPEPEPKKEETREGMRKSYTTGEWIDEKIGVKRPIAIMLGNTIDAVPQFGISQADIVYEVPVEGAYTRLMAIFQDITGLDKIGSVRSCRHYFIYFEREFDAIYAHFGQAVYAKPVLERADVNNLNGESIESISFYRDSSRKSPHNAFTSEEGIEKGIEHYEYRRDYNENYSGHYLFADDEEEVTLLKGEDALFVSPGYFVNKPWFVYDKETGLYNRFQYKDKHIDGATEEQLTVSNIIIQYCSWKNMDENGYLDINTMSGGDGKYITKGKMIDVTWAKDNEDSPARYFDQDGEEITINQGKTWVCVVRDTYKERTGIYKTEKELTEARAADQ
ncbi:DUF3048 domain-containing protein [Lachnospiraceae bacterium ZAX-1]